ncbi:MAG: DUF4956 domain-containing protein [Clostridiaceae bacterium]|jgi:uncharacterized membrane protein YczE|nr:DUF4956 domain-containing protein [Clostridiaceae bacterium]
MNKPLTFQDIFKNNFLNSQAFEGITLNQVLIALLFAFLAGMFIYLIYRISDNTPAFVNSFAVSLVALTMITTLVIMTITSNVLLSLGMVGALSIVRFRTAVKEAIDIIFMFWAITMGITIGAGFYFIATVGCLVIGTVLLGMSKITGRESLFVLVINTNQKVDQSQLEEVIKKNVRKYRFKAKTSFAQESEYTYEVRLIGGDSAFTDILTAVEGVGNVSLVGFKTHNL